MTLAFTDKSLALMKWLSNEPECIHVVKSKQHIDRVSSTFFSLLTGANQSIKALKRTGELFNIKITKLSGLDSVPFPVTFSASSIPEKIYKHITTHLKSSFEYKTEINGNKVKVFFVTEHDDPHSHVSLFNEYFERIMMWLLVAYQYSDKKCGKDLKIFIYLTPFEKELPDIKNVILNQHHANTGFTRTCPNVNSEIVLYRQEEWFKVLIHESFHLFSFDFSSFGDMDQICKEEMSSIFPIQSDFLLFEAYTETWAIMINCFISSYHGLGGDNSVQEFKSTCQFLLSFECTYKLFQMVKILDFMGLKYIDLFDSADSSVMSRNTLYREKTNVFSYSIACTLMMLNLDRFLKWCNDHNSNIVNFNNSISNVKDFCAFIRDIHDTRETCFPIFKMQDVCFYKLGKSIKDGDEWINDTLRLTVSELDR